MIHQDSSCIYSLNPVGPTHVDVSLNRPVTNHDPPQPAGGGLGLRVALAVAVAPVEDAAGAARARRLKEADPPAELRRPPLSPAPSKGSRGLFSRQNANVSNSAKY